jgi:hypothetical protein
MGCDGVVLMQTQLSQAMLHLVVPALTLGACFNPSFTDDLRCGPQRECPGSLTCATDGVCRAGGAMGVDAAPPSDGPDPMVDGGDRCVEGTGQWQALAPTAAPSARYDHSMTYDPMRQRVVLFGGRTGPENEDLLNDTWEWDGTTWLKANVPFAPSPRSGAPLVFDELAGEVVLYGGYTQGGASQETFYWDGTRWESRPIVETGPSYRSDHGLVYDAARQRMVLVGGFLGAGDGGTWELDPATSTWSDRMPAVAPPRRRNPAFAYDAARARSVLFGGRSSSGPVLDDTWEWNGTTWTNTVSDCVPTSVSPTMTYDGARSRVALFTGDAMWAWDGAAWRRQQPTTAAPPNRLEAAITFVGGAQAVLLFGGIVDERPASDTWVFR